MTTMPGPRTIRGVLAAVVLSLAASFAQAGDIVGRITDAGTGRYLSGVSVQISGTNRSTVTDTEGRYRFSGVPAGNYAIQAQYLGLEDVTATVDVPQTGTVPLDISLGSEVIEMEALRVEGFREGRSRALQQERMANYITDIISADSVGNLPDRNVAEALARVPGINLDVISGDGEGRFVSIRGIEPTFNNVTLNGATIAPPSAGGREGRAMPLDVISSSQISQIEVIKSVTPDMDGHALGGTINIKTASAFDRPEQFIYGSVETGRNSEADDNQYRAEVTYGNTFNDGRLGVALSANYSERPYVSHDIQGAWAQLNGQWYLRNLELQPAVGEKKRQGIDFNIELRPDDASEWYVRGIFNKFNQEQREQEYIIQREAGTELVNPTLVQFTRMTIEQRDFAREIDQTLLNVTAGGERRVGELTFIGDVTYSYSEEDVPLIESVQFRNRRFDMPPGLPWQYDFSGFIPVFNHQGLLPQDPAEYDLRRFREEDSLVEETTWTPRFDVQKDFSDMFGGRSGFLKAGVKATLRERFVNDNSQRPVADLTMADIAPPGPGFTFFDGKYFVPSSLDVKEALVFLNANRGLFEIDPVESASNSVEDDYDVSEDIYALYLMGNINLTDRLNMILGARWERTEADLLAFEFQEGEIPDPDNPGETIETGEVVENRGSFKYDNVLPNLQFTYSLSERSLLRFAFTGTIGRPQYEKASPISELEFELLDPNDPNSRVGELEIGNPELEPYESMNFDLAYEYYMPSGGVISLGVFHKRIDNPIYEFQEDLENVTHNNLFFEQLTRTQFRNAEEAEITGYELALSLPFSTFFETGVLEGFGIEANATFIDSEVTVFGRENQELPFFRQPDEIYNLAIYFEKYRFSTRLAWNRQTASLRNLSGNRNNDHWDLDREYTDLQASYKLTENFTIYANWQNIFQDRADRSYGSPDSGRVRRSEFYGSYVNAGVRFRF